MGITLSLNGKTALITGGSRGIGAACVRVFIKAGARVVFTYQRAGAQAAKLVEDCGGEEHCVAVQANLDTIGATKSLVDTVLHHFDRLDLLVVNLSLIHI